jgi:hypothetical protein
MDSETLRAAFYKWLDLSQVEFEVMLDDAYDGLLKLLVDSQVVVINFAQCQVSVKTLKTPFPEWRDWACTYMTDHACAVQTGEADLVALIDTLLKHFAETKEYGPVSDHEAYDYREEIIAQEQQSTVQQTLPSVFRADYHDHFIFREARAARQLLETLSAPGHKYAYGIAECPSTGVVRLELGHLDSQTMKMLGLNFSSLLTVTVAISEVHLMQTQHLHAWTSQLLGFLKFDTSQEGLSPLCCTEYITGCLQIFKEESYAQFRDKGSDQGPRKRAKLAYSEELDQLLEMGFDFVEAETALQSEGYDLEAALDALTSKKPNSWGNAGAFFCNLLFYLKEHLENCTNYCFICYKQHDYDSSRIRPCSKDICQFRFEEELGFAVFPEIIANPGLIHLDLSFAAVSAGSNRAHNIFEPFPSFFLKREQIRGRAGFLTREEARYRAEMDSNKDFDALIAAFKGIPDPSTMRELCSNEESLVQLLTSGGSVLSYKLLKYIITTNRLSFIRLEAADRVRALPEEILQYLVTNHSTETHFQSQKALEGSFFAFHGSAPENWYSIVRNGIRNLSHTHMMTAGAAAGAGVYAAALMSTSLKYCKSKGVRHSAWRHSILSGYFVMGIIEVIRRDNDRGGGVYVIADDRQLLLRYLLLIPTSLGFDTNIVASSLGLDTHLDALQQKDARH